MTHVKSDSTEPLPAAILSAVACKISGGKWAGGHDVSGHAFMLVLTSASLVLELLGSSQPLNNDALEGKDKNEDEPSRLTELATGDNSLSPAARMSRNFVWAVAGLSLWMLLMTGIWFHTWVEKMTGLIIALATVYAVYFLPRTLLAWRNVIGIPGR